MTDTKKILLGIGATSLIAAGVIASDSPAPTAPVTETAAENHILQVEAKTETKPTTTAAPKKTSSCNPNYSGCLKSGAGDYDCAGGSGNGPNYTGKVTVLGYDEFGLDRDGDGVGCE